MLLRERLKAGDSDQRAIAYIVARYGEFVLLKPPVEPATYALWFGPPALLVLAAIVILLRLRRRPDAAPPPPLSADERRRLARLLDEGS